MSHAGFEVGNNDFGIRLELLVGSVLLDCIVRLLVDRSIEGGRARVDDPGSQGFCFWSFAFRKRKKDLALGFKMIRNYLDDFVYYRSSFLDIVS